MRKTVVETLEFLSQQNIQTWFDLGLFIDRLRQSRCQPECSITQEQFFDRVSKGVGICSFYLAVDGVSVEMMKYARALEDILPKTPIHFIVGRIDERAKPMLASRYRLYEDARFDGFDNWPLYKLFFQKKLKRGGASYNKLITLFWDEVLAAVKSLGSYIEKEQIETLYLVNVCSNPGNVSFAFATVLLSELMGIPVINNNHDFYWEGGSSRVEITQHGAKPGPRDFFFKNFDIGEVFSVIEMLYPWESPSWMTVNINKSQSAHCIEVKGHNPANVSEIGTAVDVDRFRNITKRDEIETMGQVASMLARYQKHISIISPTEVLDTKLLEESRDPILIGRQKTSSFEFAYNNIVFLQPTRVMPRKRIEVGFRLIGRLFEDELFCQIFESNPQLSITFLITGPVPLGQQKYLQTLLIEFRNVLDSLPVDFSSRVFLGFLFSEFDKPRFKERFAHPIEMPELYSIASLILLPSETEGRGLPIIEATACGRPIFCRRYYPEHVYAEVIGEDLPEVDRLRVMEYQGKRIRERLIHEMVQRVFFPQNFIADIEHNQKVVLKRYSVVSLRNSMHTLLKQLYCQCNVDATCQRNAASAIKKYRTHCIQHSGSVVELLDSENRQYLPGFGRTGFMLALKSLIDPSFFRVEEQRIRGYILRFAKRLVDLSANPELYRQQANMLREFYNTVESIFRCEAGAVDIRHDHSFAYRHRSRRHFSYWDLTHQELTGVVNMLFHQMFSPSPEREVTPGGQFFVDWNLALFQLTNAVNLAIDERKRLMDALAQNVPFAYFPGQYLKYEIEFFVLQCLRARFGLSIDEVLTREKIIGQKSHIAPVFILCRRHTFGRYLTADTLLGYLQNSQNKELQLLLESGLVRVVPTEQFSVGLHVYELGPDAVKILKEIQKQEGFLITNGQTAAVMTDTLAIDRFHIGKARNPIVARMLGVPRDSGFVAFVPAGVRATLSYPVPTQTTRDVSMLLQSDSYKRLCDQFSEPEVLRKIQTLSRATAAPLSEILDSIALSGREEDRHKGVQVRQISGVYADGLPWSGVLAKVTISESSAPWRFTSVTAGSTPKTVLEFVQEFEAQQRASTVVAWNGGYILNPELVGKLGLGADSIGAPLGLVMADRAVKGLPLFNKPAILIDADGRVRIERITLQAGFSVAAEERTLYFSAAGYNASCAADEQFRFYDLMYEGDALPGDGSTIVQLSGNKVHSVHRTKPGEYLKRVPIGAALVVPEFALPDTWKEIGTELNFSLNGVSDNTVAAIEAGPLLLRQGKDCIDMDIEGWTKEASIKTQAARLDFTDMRGPKIAAGLDEEGNVYVLTVNGRLRESVGATHADMASILRSVGVTEAMGFDPGGSSTLVVNGKAVNISPYNSNYESDPFALPPEPRGVSNVLIAWTEDNSS